MPLYDLGPNPQLGYTGNWLSRASEKREDAAFLDALWHAPTSGGYLVSTELVVLRRTPEGLNPLFPLAEAVALADRPEPFLLGLNSETACFALGFNGAQTESLKARPEFEVVDLRTIAVRGLVPPEHLAPLAEAKALLAWHARHRFCANCGAPTTPSHAGWRRDCAACSAQHFPRTDPVVIMLAVDGDDCLLGGQSRFPPGVYSCLAGFVEPGETIEEAVRRETLEEAGIRCGDVRYFASQPWPFPMSLMIGCHAQALNRDIIVDRTELEDARWFSREEAAQMLMRQHPDGLSTPPPIAIAHHIIRAWVEQGA